MGRLSVRLTSSIRFSLRIDRHTWTLDSGLSAGWSYIGTMSSEGDSPLVDYDETASVVQDDNFEDTLGTQIEEHIDFPYDHSTLLEESAPTPTTDSAEQSKSNHEAPDISEDRQESIYETVEDDRLSAQHTSSLQEQAESPQTSQGPSPTQRSQESTLPVEATSPAASHTLRPGPQTRLSEDIEYANVAMNNGSYSPVVKTEEQDDDVCFITSNTIDEAIIISDDEDLVEPEPDKQSKTIYAGRISSDDRAANPGAECISMGNSILQTRTTQRKPTKAQIEMMKQAQQMLAKQLNRKSVTGGAGTIFGGTAGHGHVGSPAVNALKEADAVALTDENAWMNEEMDDDSDDSVSSVM